MFNILNSRENSFTILVTSITNTLINRITKTNKIIFVYILMLVCVFSLYVEFGLIRILFVRLIKMSFLIIYLIWNYVERKEIAKYAKFFYSHITTNTHTNRIKILELIACLSPATALVLETVLMMITCMRKVFTLFKRFVIFQRSQFGFLKVLFFFCLKMLSLRTNN